VSATFAFERPHRPLSVRLLNAGGRPLARAITLDPDALVRAAERRTGLRAAGDDGFREPLARLCASAESEADLHPLGRWLVRDHLVGLVAERLRLRDHVERHPEVLDVPVDRPVLVLATPRSGSTFLHNLLALDPRSRVPALWEVRNPVPRAARRGRVDPRVREARKTVEGIERLAPVMLKIHPVSAEGPEEDRFLLEKTFLGVQFLAYHRAPSYVDWFLEQPEERLFEACLETRRQIQVLKHGDGGRRWVGKSTVHALFGRALVRAFPDACFVLLHRDPLEAIPSICSLGAASRSIFSDRVDLADLGREALRAVDNTLARLHHLREAPAPASACEIRYEDLVDDPLAVVARVYEAAGMDLTPAVERGVREYVAAHPQHAGGVHRYRLEDYGLTREHVERTLARHEPALAGFGARTPG
jgi:hypothetical protein